MPGLVGDTQIPFGKLGRQLHLPQTATLALRAPEQYVPLTSSLSAAVLTPRSRIPFLYEEAYQWYPSFDQLGDLIAHPNPTPALELMTKVVDHLINACGWPSHRIHFFGFAQGGTVAAEFALRFWRTELALHQKALPSASPGPASASSTPHAFGSVVSVCGPLISYPTPPQPCPTPLLVFHRPSPAESALPSGALAALKKGFAPVEEVKMKGEGMPRSKDEFEPIMRFWSEKLGRRQMEGFYEVISGSTA